MYFVYILQSLKNGMYYIGSTDNIERRLKEHNSGKSNFTSNLLPLKLVFSQRFETRTIARKMELWLKKQKSRKLIEKIVLSGKINKVI